MIYPLLLDPVYKDYLWGGTRLKTAFGKKTDLSPLAESWELACHKDGVNRIMNGQYRGYTLNTFIQQHPEALGTKTQAGSFPLLVKLIDACGDLSVQVHPDEEYAKRTEGEHGKTEMWYILDCLPHSSIIYGLKEQTDKETLRRHITEGTLLDIVNRVQVKKGDVFLIEPGTLHAIGKGIIIAEIQQNSNVTYRVYDYHRIGKDGKPRELHIKKALEVIKPTPALSMNTQHITKQNEGFEETLLQQCPYFAATLLEIDGCAKLTTTAESFSHLLCIDGTGILKYKNDQLTITKGNSIFIPADSCEYQMTGQLSIIISTL